MRSGPRYRSLLTAFVILLNLLGCKEVEVASEEGLVVAFEQPYSVTCIAFSPDGATLASGSVDKTVRLWDIATGEELAATIRIPQNRIWSVTFSPDGMLLATGSDDGLIRLWSVEQVLGND